MPRVTQSVLAGGAGAGTERGGTVKDGRDREEEEEREDDEGGKDDFG